MINLMRHMGNSGKLAIVSACVAMALLVLTAITLEEAAMFTFLGVVAVGYLASVAEVLSRRRYFALVLGAIGSSLFVGFAIAFLRMWGLAFNEDANATGIAVSTQDSDSYFYLAVAAGFAALLVLFAGAVWPGRRRKGVRPAGRNSDRQPEKRRLSGGAVPNTVPRAAQRSVPRAASTSKRPTAAGTMQRRGTAGQGKGAAGQRKGAPRI
jgi:lysylphosphatidylglycerol synthetase-like protein (DUF2156 family)